MLSFPYLRFLWACTNFYHVFKFDIYFIRFQYANNYMFLCFHVFILGSLELILVLQIMFLLYFQKNQNKRKK